MKSTTYLISFLFIMCIIGLLGVYVQSTYSHEKAHKEIAIHNGCVKYEMDYFFNPHFKCLERNHNLTLEERNIEYVLDSMNEVVGYNTIAIWSAIIFSSFMICMTIILVYSEWERKKSG